jgi:PAS domain S-box-containing protein
MEILGQLLSAHVVLPSLLDERQMAEFSAHALRIMPSVSLTAARIGGIEVHDGDAGIHWSGVPVEVDAETRSSWRSDDTGYLLTLPVRTRHPHGLLCLLTSSREDVEPYVPFLENFAAALGLTLENRRQRRELERVADSLASSRKEYELLFDKMTSGFAVHEMVTDARGKPVDYRFLLVNRAFEELTGLRAEEIVGKTALEVLPGLEPEWIARYATVALDGRQLEFESFARELGKHYRVVAYSPSPRRFATVFNDVTERKMAEEKLKALYREEHRIASILQQHFMHAPPDVPGVELAVISETAQKPELVGGDFADVFLAGDGRLVVVVGDVAGKGVQAAGLTETVRSSIRALALIDTSPAFLLRKTNQLLLAQRLGSEQFVTALVMAVDRFTGAIEYSSAGHPPAVRVGLTGHVLLEPTYGTPLGAFPTDYLVSRDTLSPSETLVLYTDGLIEAREDGGALFEDRLPDVLREIAGERCEEAAERLRDSAQSFAGTLRDDFLVVALRLPEASQVLSPAV